MRRKGSGSIYLRRDGRWAAAVQRNGRRIFRYARTREEAEALLAELLSIVDPGMPTLARFARQWLELRRMEIRPSTWDHYERLLRVHILPSIGSKRLDQIDPPTIRRLLADRIEAGCSVKTVRLIYSALRKLLNDAVEAGLIPENPVRRVRPPRLEPRPFQAWTPEQIRRFIEGARGHPYEALFLFLLGTGARIGEALALRWEDVDLEAGIARISRSVTFIRGQWVESLPKTPHGRRSVSIPDFALRALRELPRDRERVFATSTGSLPQRKDLRASLRRLCRRLSLPPIRIHDLRHLHASILIRAGVDLKTVQRRLGHASAAFTLQAYAHLLDPDDRHAARAADALLS